jgi:hypothetical protein
LFSRENLRKWLQIDVGSYWFVEIQADSWPFSV